MFALLRNKPLLDDDTTLWIWQSYAWALKHFDAQLFFSDKTQLITPSKKHFPDQADAPQALAEKIFARVKSYAGMENWPTTLVPDPSGEMAITAPAIKVDNDYRGTNALITTEESQALPIRYNPIQIRQPNILIAILAQSIASPLAHLAPEPPPGGIENLGPATDLLAIFFGFGLFLTNNAFNYSIGGCGSCKPRGVELFGDLTEEQMAYALALFCSLKEIPKSEVLPHLKSTIRPFFKKALKEVGHRKEDLATLKEICAK